MIFCTKPHCKHLDIHYVLAGREKIKWSPIDGLQIVKPYDENNDAIFCRGKEPSCDFVLQDDKIAVMFPYDGHSCQHIVGKESDEIKKVVVKILIK